MEEKEFTQICLELLELYKNFGDMQEQLLGYIDERIQKATQDLEKLINDKLGGGTIDPDNPGGGGTTPIPPDLVDKINKLIQETKEEIDKLNADVSTNTQAIKDLKANVGGIVVQELYKGDLVASRTIINPLTTPMELKDIYITGKSYRNNVLLKINDDPIIEIKDLKADEIFESKQPIALKAGDSFNVEIQPFELGNINNPIAGNLVEKFPDITFKTLKLAKDNVIFMQGFIDDVKTNLFYDSKYNLLYETKDSIKQAFINGNKFAYNDTPTNIIIYNGAIAKLVDLQLKYLGDKFLIALKTDGLYLYSLDTKEYKKIDLDTYANIDYIDSYKNYALLITKGLENEIVLLNTDTNTIILKAKGTNFNAILSLNRAIMQTDTYLKIFDLDSGTELLNYTEFNGLDNLGYWRMDEVFNVASDTDALVLNLVQAKVYFHAVEFKSRPYDIGESILINTPTAGYLFNKATKTMDTNPNPNLGGLLRLFKYGNKLTVISDTDVKLIDADNMALIDSITNSKIQKDNCQFITAKAGATEYLFYFGKYNKKDTTAPQSTGIVVIDTKANKIVEDVANSDNNHVFMGISGIYAVFGNSYWIWVINSVTGEVKVTESQRNPTYWSSQILDKYIIRSDKFCPIENFPESFTDIFISNLQIDRTITLNKHCAFTTFDSVSGIYYGNYTYYLNYKDTFDGVVKTYQINSSVSTEAKFNTLAMDNNGNFGAYTQLRETTTGSKPYHVFTYMKNGEFITFTPNAPLTYGNNNVRFYTNADKFFVKDNEIFYVGNSPDEPMRAIATLDYDYHPNHIFTDNNTFLFFSDGTNSSVSPQLDRNTILIYSSSKKIITQQKVLVGLQAYRIDGDTIYFYSYDGIFSYMLGDEKLTQEYQDSIPNELIYDTLRLKYDKEGIRDIPLIDSKIFMKVDGVK